MKRFIVLSLFLLLSAFSSTANAYLYEGTWSSDLGTASLAEWTVNYSNGITGTINSLNGQYQYTGTYVDGGLISVTNPYYEIGNIRYYPEYSNYNGTVNFLFADGNNYNASGTSTVNFTRKYNLSTGTYLGNSIIDEYTKATIIDNGKDYLLSSHFIGSGTSSLILSSNTFYPIYEEGEFSSVEFNVKAVSAVPIPSSMWLLLTGIICLVGVRKFTSDQQMI
jgi:prepilin-type processing-associated H-X9-DG protein